MTRVKATQPAEAPLRSIQYRETPYITRHFRWDEFRCHNGIEVPTRYRKNVIDLAAELELVRRIWKRPITILSGFRTLAYNKKIGGAEKSLHTSARAADIVVAGVPANEVADAIEAGIAANDFHFGGLGRYRTFTHCDIRPNKARWEG